MVLKQNEPARGLRLDLSRRWRNTCVTALRMRAKAFELSLPLVEGQNFFQTWRKVSRFHYWLESTRVSGYCFRPMHGVIKAGVIKTHSYLHHNDQATNGATSVISLCVPQINLCEQNLISSSIITNKLADSNSQTTSFSHFLSFCYVLIFLLQKNLQ